MPGSDGFVQLFKVKIKTTVLERPVAKCVPLEATEENDHSEHLSLQHTVFELCLVSLT